MTNNPSSTSILSIRVSPDERAILEAAAEQSRTSLSDFMRRKALEAAEVDMLVGLLSPFRPRIGKSLNPGSIVLP